MSRTLTLLLASLAVAGCNGGVDTDTDTDTDTAPQNQPPTGGAAAIGPAATLDDLVVTITEQAIDPDGDAVTYRYAWSRDGQAVPEHTGDTVPAAATARDQRWSVAITPTDGTVDGQPFTAEVTVANTAPVITEVTLSPDRADTRTVLSATPTGEDVDGDALTWTYAWTVDGAPAGSDASLDGATAFAKGQQIVLTVEASDGAASATWTSATIVVENSPPTAPVVAFEPDPPSTTSDLVCVIDGPATDPDGDPLPYTFTFEVDGARYTGATETTDHPGDTIPAASLRHGQEWTCTAVAADGDATGPAATVTSEPTYSRCGPKLHTDPEQVVDGWTLCYVRGDDSDAIKTAACRTLVDHLSAPVFGCWHGYSTYPHENDNNMLTNACRAGVQNSTTYTGWGGTRHILTVCIQD